MAKDIPAAVREVCLSFPDAEEYLSHGSPNFRVRGGKTYAVFVVNHHGDGKVALWLNAPEGAQAARVRESPKHYFVPPYVGPRGWLGVELDQGLNWKRVAELVRESYEKIAPRALIAKIGKTIVIEAPAATLSAEQKDPLTAPAAQRVLKKLAAICLAFPETNAATQFGAPVWRAGVRSFAIAYLQDGRLTLGFWVGVDQQGLYTNDRRYSIPKYMGHNGWIALDVSKACNWEEIRSLAEASYRHFALKRMLAKLDAR